ncbi:MAG TPA: hypothetical protein PL015_09080 [Opitutaceae bacterium]|nr:hypothetical protein [Opitutaceae bacterium]
MDMELSATILVGIAIAGTLWLATAGLRQQGVGCGPSTAHWGRLLLGFFGIFFGLRLGAASGLVSWAPYLDQWKVDIYELIFRLHRQELHWGDLLAPHNEHRILFTKLLTLGLLPLNGEWDNRPLVVASLAFQAAAFAWFATIACRSLTPWRSLAVVAALVGVASLSCDWENFVSGFQSQFHLFVLGTMLVLSILPAARPGSWPAWGALAVALALLATLGSGFMTAMAAACALGAGAFLRREFSWRTAVPPMACIALVALGAMTRAHFTAHDFLHAKSVAGWSEAFLAYASWPLPPHAAALAALWLPWGILLIQMWRQRDTSPFSLLIFSLGLWTLWQAMALAWSRAGLLPLVSSRYTGLLMWAMLTNTAAVVRLLPLEKARFRHGWTALACCWLAVLGGAYLWRSHTIYRPMARTFRTETVRQETHFREFMRTDNPTHIEAYTMPEIPYPVPSDLVKWMRNPAVREALPAPLRRDVAQRVPPPDGATPEAGWLTIVARTLLRRDVSSGLALAGAALAAWSWRRCMSGGGPARTA